MSGYFQRLAQRSGLRSSAPKRGGVRREPVSPANAIGIEQGQVVEVMQPSSAAAPTLHERTLGEATVSKPRTDQPATTQSQTAIQELHSESTAAPIALPVTRDAATTPDRRVERTSPVVEQSVTVSANAVAAPDPKSEPKRAVAHRIQSPHPSAPLELEERRLVSPGLSAESRTESIRDGSSPLAVDITSPRFAQSERESIDVEMRTASRSQVATDLFAQRASAPASTPRAPTAIDVHIGTVAVEIHQPAPQPVAPPPPVLVPAPAPRPAAPRERFSPSRHYIRTD
jgi:hypothetical protein